MKNSETSSPEEITFAEELHLLASQHPIYTADFFSQFSNQEKGSADTNESSTPSPTEAPPFETFLLPENSYTKIDQNYYKLAPRHREILTRHGIDRLSILYRGYFSLPQDKRERDSLLHFLGFDYIANHVEAGMIVPIKHDVLFPAIPSQAIHPHEHPGNLFRAEYDYLLYSDEELQDETGRTYPYFRSMLRGPKSRFDIPPTVWESVRFMRCSKFDRRILWCQDVLSADFLQ